MKGKTYLGDSVYAKFDGYHIVLTTENGISTTNTIYLEEQVFVNLVRLSPFNKGRTPDMDLMGDMKPDAE